MRNYKWLSTCTPIGWDGINKIVGLRNGVIEVSAYNPKNKKSVVIQVGSNKLMDFNNIKKKLL